MELTNDDYLIPLSTFASMCAMSPAHLRWLHRQGRLMLVRPNRNFYVRVGEAKRFLGIDG